MQARSRVEGEPWKVRSPRFCSTHRKSGVSTPLGDRARSAVQLSRQKEITGVRRALSRRGPSIWLPKLGRGRTIDDSGKSAGSAEACRLEAKELVAELEPRERQILASIVGGYSLIRVAGELGVSLEDAIRLKASLMSKLGANVTADLVRIGIHAQVDGDH